jgi:hypothetical protein
MLDTVIITIRLEPFNILDNWRFEPSAEGIFDRFSFGKFKKCIQNATAEDKSKGIYKPRLTAYKRPDGVFLKIEFSAPKLLFGNNLDELEENDFPQVLDKLYMVLLTMGVRIFRELLATAPVSALHPSKNIPLSGGYTSIFAIRELSKIDISRKFDIEMVKFRNGGEALQIYCNRHSLVFYDKKNDADKPAKRAIDKDQTSQQKTLFNVLTNQKAELLRMELRFSKRTKLNEVLESLGCRKNPTFKEVFNKELCQKLLLSYWHKFFDGNMFLFDTRNDTQLILQSLLKGDSEIKIAKAIAVTGFIVLGKDDAGMRGFRNIAETYKPKTNWTKLSKWIDGVNKSIAAIPLHGFIKDIERELTEFKPYKVRKTANLP